MCSGLVFKAHRLCVRLCVSFNSWLESDKETEKYEHDRGNLVFSASGEEPHGGSRFVYPSSGHRGKFRPPWSSPNALGRPHFALGRPMFALGGVNVIPRWARTRPAGLARASHAVNSDSGVPRPAARYSSLCRMACTQAQWYLPHERYPPPPRTTIET